MEEGDLDTQSKISFLNDLKSDVTTVSTSIAKKIYQQLQKEIAKREQLEKRLKECVGEISIIDPKISTLKN